MKHILVVEDDTLIRDELVTLLEKAGYRVDALVDFKDTSCQILSYDTDLILLDLNLPEENGFHICQNVKAQGSIPILVLTSRDQLKDELASLKVGADDYLTKPFRKERLLARIENLLKRYEGRKNLIEKEHVLLDRHTYTLYMNGRSILLAQNQGKLLERLFTAGSQVVTKDDLSMALWDTIEYIDENALQVNIARLKKVMREERIPFKVKSVRGVGYKLEKGKDDED